MSVCIEYEIHLADAVECSGNVGDDVATVDCEDLVGEPDLFCSVDFGPPEPCEQSMAYS